MSLTLEHKFTELTNTKGEDAQVSDINNLKILINGYDNDLYVIPRKEGDMELIKEAQLLSDNILEGFSIFEKFVVNDGSLVHENAFITFYDEETKQEILIKEMRNPSLLSAKLFNHSLEDEEAEKIFNYITQLAIENEKEEAKEKVEIVEPAETIQVEIPKEEVAEVKDEEPVAEVKVEEPIVAEVKVEEPIVAEVKVEEPVSEVKVKEPIAEVKPEEVKVEEATPITEQSEKQLAENVIPAEIMAEYDGYKNDLMQKGFTELSYKNYRYFVALPDYSNAYLLLLTPQGIAQMNMKYFPYEATDKIIKYMFRVDKKDKETRKTLYFDVEKNSITIKRPKKGDMKADDKKEEKAVEVGKV